MSTQSRKFWLKSIGSAKDQMTTDYLTESNGGRLDLVEEIHFAEHKRPSGMKAGDMLVLYAAGHERIFGIAEIRDGEIYEHHLERDKEFPFALRVDVPMLVGNLHIAPPLSSMNVGPLSVRQQSHIALTPEQYRLAVEALTAALHA